MNFLNNWKSIIGGAIVALGTVLGATGVVSAADAEYITRAGYAMLGIGVAHKIKKLQQATELAASEQAHRDHVLARKVDAEGAIVTPAIPRKR